MYEQRSYCIQPALLDAYLRWANERAVPLLTTTFGFDVIGFWKVDGREGTVLAEDVNIVWMIRWADRQVRDDRWTAVRASPEWAHIRQGIPDFHRRPPSIQFLHSTPASPLK